MTDRRATCPYRGLPEQAFWRQAVATPASEAVNPAAPGSFRIAATDKVATAGSCFAQNIARYLGQAGCSYFVTEPAPPILPPALATTYNYGTFSARFGNIYTTRQLLQLFQRAYGEFVPAEGPWVHDGRLFDPFRPQIQPRGFASATEYALDRAQHLAAIRRMIEACDVFVFTLGLTEAWVSRHDGAVFPICPGCGAGTFDPDAVAFHNFGVEEVAADLLAALRLLRGRNPGCRIVLTVSPVPLIATASGQHVLTATTWSKAVLRVAAEQVSRALEACDYFPSYEIVLGPQAGGRYLAADLRSVTSEGVAQVMRCFAAAYLPASAETPVTPGDAPAILPSASAGTEAPATLSSVVADLICDEEELAR